MRDYQIYSKIKHIAEVRNKFLKENESSVERQKFFGIFNYCLNSLKDEYKFILLNSYFNITYQFWWLDYFCKSSYYRKRFVAVNSFVALYEMIYENFNDDSAFINFA